MEFVPYDQFKDIEFIAEGGFSKIYKATWINGPISNWESNTRKHNFTVVLKKLNNSKNITSKELHELKVFYDFSTKMKGGHNSFVSRYYGITQDPITQEIMIIMPYYNSGDLTHYITNDFYNISWYIKLNQLWSIASGLANIHSVCIIHREFHSGNIFFGTDGAVIGDLGISKSATESTDENEHYGIIPYMAPEILNGQKYTKASDIYSFGMIMWEFMTGRRPFWDKIHNTELIIEICDGLRPPIVTNAPENYIELIKACWHSDPMKRPTANDIKQTIYKIRDNEKYNPTVIIKSSDIGPVMINNPDVIYKSSPLSNMIQSAMSLRNSRNQYLKFDPLSCYQNNNGKEKLFEDDLIKNNNNNNYGQSIKRRKLFENENENNDYLTKENEFDINMSS